MSRPKTNNVKWQIVIAKEFSDKVEAYCQKIGVSKSALVAMALASMLSKEQLKADK